MGVGTGIEMNVVHWDIDKVNQQIFDTFGNHVVGGPFKGMYVDQRVAWKDGNIGKKLLGVYESELHPYIYRIINRFRFAVYPNIVNIGSAEGYYAVGLARTIPSSRVRAIDTNQESLDILVENARQNSCLERVTAEKSFTPEITDLIFADCEGCELQLFEKPIIDQLTKCVLLIETHDFMYEHKHVTQPLVQRFSATHNVEVIPPVPGKREVTLPDGELVLIIDELRPTEANWIYCEPKNETL